MGVKRNPRRISSEREYLSPKQMRAAYRNYMNRYEAQEAKMLRRGERMNDEMMTFGSYKATRRAYVEDLQSRGKRVININQSIVSDQQYEFSRLQARGIKDIAETYNIENLKDQSILKLRSGQAIRNEDLSLINNALKEAHPDWTGAQRARFITDNVFADSE